jgi:hypothetical protein
MQQISFYLKKFDSLGFDEAVYKKELIKIISSKCNINLKEDDIKIVRDKLIISKIGPEKTEIWLKKNEIEKETNEGVGVILNKSSQKKLV